MAKVLVFTVIEKLGYKSDVTKNGKLAPWVKDSIKDEYGIKKRGINHESIYASEAPNGDELYIEVVAESDDWKEFWKVVKSIRETRPRRRDDLDKWVETSGFKLLETEGSIGMYDEYLLDVEKIEAEYQKSLNSEREEMKNEIKGMLTEIEEMKRSK